MAAPSKGAVGEVLAARFLRDKGYTLIASNYRCRHGEIDIIASKDGYIVFAEVKTRRESSLYAPREAVTVSKQRKILLTASMFLATRPVELQPRFDVVEVITADDNPVSVVEINHIMGAYESGGLDATF